MPTIKTNGISTYYEEYGKGPPVVFLHGAFGDHRLWAEQVQPLTQDYRIIVYDLRGHGKTGSSNLNAYSMDLFVEDLRCLIESLKIEQPAICGLSMGGMIAQRYAAEHAETIAALCSIGAVTPELLTRSEWVERRLWLPAIETCSAVVGRERVLPIVQLVNRLRYDERTSGDLEEAERIQQAHESGYPPVTEAEAEKIRQTLTKYGSLTTDYSSITVPTLLLYGEYESDTMARHAEYMATAISDATAREIPEAGHNSHVDNPAFVVDSLHEFLRTELAL